MKNPIHLFKVNEKKLLKQEEEIKREISNIDGLVREEGSEALTEPEMESRAESLFEKTQLMAQRATLAKALSDIKSALKKIRKNDYGICQNCKQPIQEARLKVFPAAKYCIKCAETIEDK